MDEGLIPGPRLEACSPHLETTGNERPHWWFDSRNTGMQVFVDGPEEFRKAVRTQIRRGADWIKILPTGGHGISDPHNRRLSHDELVAVVQTAHEMGKRVRAHASWRELIHECVEAGVRIVDRDRASAEPAQQGGRGARRERMRDRLEEAVAAPAVVEGLDPKMHKTARGQSLDPPDLASSRRDCYPQGRPGERGGESSSARLVSPPSWRYATTD